MISVVIAIKTLEKFSYGHFFNHIYSQKLTIKEFEVSTTSWRHFQGKLNQICDLKSNYESSAINLHNLDKDASANSV